MDDAQRLWKLCTLDQFSPRELYRVMQLRSDVFVVEQNCIYHDFDGKDENSVHMMCWRDDELLAYQRCVPPGLSFAESSIGRIVVAPAGRGEQLGRELVQRGIEYNLQRWPATGIQIGAQAYLLAFYSGLGFEAQGEEYLEDGILHLDMIYRDRGSVS